MTSDAVKPRQLIADAICHVAPDIGLAEVEDLGLDEALKDALELDSMDMLNVATAIYERCGVDIPERDYSHMDTLGEFENYLAKRLASIETSS